MPRAAINTSVIWSGLAHPAGPSGDVIDSWYGGSYDLIWTDETVAEYRDVLLDPGYLAQLDYSVEVDEFLTLVELCGVRVLPAQIDFPVIRDAHDRIWQAAAVGGNAQYLVTADDDFLAEPDLIRSMRDLGVRIVTPAIFRRELNEL